MMGACLAGASLSPLPAASSSSKFKLQKYILSPRPLRPTELG